MQLFFNNQITVNTNSFTFSKDESKHIVKVLRKKINDTLHITNGAGWLFEAEIISDSEKKCLVNIKSRKFQAPKKYNLHLAVAPTKLNDRYEWFLEKATEIGISSITPIICNNSERKVIKPKRFEKIIESAVKQSLQLYIPKLNPATTFKQFITSNHTGNLFIAHCEKTKRISLKSAIQPNQEITILIGPEGDFSTKEIELALQNKYIPVTLGNNRLRTETAAIVACNTVAIINETNV